MKSARALAERGPSAQIKSARALEGYWLDQMMRAIQRISEAESVRSL
jgi:hypothetical protein